MFQLLIDTLPRSFDLDSRRFDDGIGDNYRCRPKPNLATLGIKDTPTRGEGSGHNLRKKPKTTKFFGIPISSPKKKDKKK